MTCINMSKSLNYLMRNDKITSILTIGDKITFKDLSGNKFTGKIVKIKFKRDGSMKYKIKKSEIKT